jgi:hypothetical protein
MKTSKLAGLLFLTTSLLGNPVLAGREGGNGGVGIICRNSADQITSAEVLDIFEGKINTV